MLVILFLAGWIVGDRRFDSQSFVIARGSAATTSNGMPVELDKPTPDQILSTDLAV